MGLIAEMKALDCRNEAPLPLLGDLGHEWAVEAGFAEALEGTPKHMGMLCPLQTPGDIWTCCLPRWVSTYTWIRSLHVFPQMGCHSHFSPAPRDMPLHALWHPLTRVGSPQPGILCGLWLPRSTASLSASCPVVSTSYHSDAGAGAQRGELEKASWLQGPSFSLYR